MEFDIVIPVGPNDVRNIAVQIECTQKNVVGYRNIYIVSPVSVDISGCIYIPETVYPFSMSSVSEIHGKNSRNGWYLQQLLKLYAGTSIPGILRHFLVIDADTYFLRPTYFFTEDGKPLYNMGSEHHIPYFQHMLRLLPGLTRCIPQWSGICHHMMFDNEILRELFEKVETHHLHRGPFWRIFLELVAPANILASGASEYEIYFNYLLHNHSAAIKIRQLQWRNVGVLNLTDSYDYVSWHWYMRQR